MSLANCRYFLYFFVNCQLIFYLSCLLLIANLFFLYFYSMTDSEFDIMDELYFISSFEELNKNILMEESELVNALHSLIKKGWVKCLEKETDQEFEIADNFKAEFKKYNYLATKAGLLAHNSR
jgi:hypothetical protein